MRKVSRVTEGLIVLFAASSWARSLISFLVGLGVGGPFLLETLDSSFFYVPLANELLLFALIHGGGGSAPNWMWILYALSGAAGTVAGVALLDLVMRRVGAGGVERLVGRRRFGKLKRKLEHHTGWVVFVAAMLPPPFPFRFTMMTASALQCARGRMLVSVFGGRAVRFAAEALLILYFGRRFLDFMNSVVAPYSVRPKPGATVSAPLSWREVERKKIRTADFHIKNMPRRVESVGDLFKPVLKKGQRLEGVFERARELFEADSKRRRAAKA